MHARAINIVTTDCIDINNNYYFSMKKKKTFYWGFKKKENKYFKKKNRILKKWFLPTWEITALKFEFPVFVEVFVVTLYSVHNPWAALEHDWLVHPSDVICNQSETNYCGITLCDVILDNAY